MPSTAFTELKRRTKLQVRIAQAATSDTAHRFARLLEIPYRIIHTD